MHYDRHGRVIGLWDWAGLFEDDDYRRIAADQIGHFWVSTVWLGVDHSFGRGPPLIFETMVFGPGGSSDELYQERYSTEADAKAGHAKAVRKFRRKLLRSVQND